MLKEMENEKMLCPVCLHQGNGDPIIERGFPRHFICEKCGFVYMFPVPQIDNLNGYYKTNYWLSHHNISGNVKVNFDKEGASERARSIYQWLKEGLQAGVKVLEIGSGFGHNLAYINHKTGADVFGVELSEEGAKNSVDVYGIPIFVGGWEDFVLDEQKFDVIIMSHVLEHFIDPGKALQKVAKSTTHNGVLFVEVPNILRPNNTKFLKTWLSKEHISYFSLNKLEYLLSKNGFEILRVEEKHYVRILARIQENVVRSMLKPEYRRVTNALFWHRVQHTIYRVRRKLGLI